MDMPDRVVWTDRCQEALQKVQVVLCNDPVIKLADLSKPFTVKTDASSTGIGGILWQEFEGGLHPVLFTSRRLLDRERRYSTIERECLAIVWAIDKFARYLWWSCVFFGDWSPITDISSTKQTEKQSLYAMGSCLPGISLSRCTDLRRFQPGSLRSVEIWLWLRTVN